MIYGPIIAAVVLALLFTFAFSLLSRRERRRGTSGWLFFLILFFAMWAGGLWIYPSGPLFWGVSWLPVLFVGLVAALLLSATDAHVSPDYGDSAESGQSSSGLRDSNEGRVVHPKPNRPARQSNLAVGLFFWVLLAVLAVAIVAGYLAN